MIDTNLCLLYNALDENEKPTKVPGIILETEEEKLEYEKAKLRKERRKSYNV